MTLKPLFEIDIRIRRVLLLGLLARLVVMPFAVHSDCLHTYWVGSCAAFDNESRFGMQTLLTWLHVGYLRLASPVLPFIETFCNDFESIASDPNATWFNIVNLHNIFRALLVFKFPYLLFDLGCALLVYRLGTDKSRSVWMLTFWWLHPLLFFGVYIFGRHETITLFWVLLSLYLIKCGKRKWGVTALGIAIATRYYTMFLLPFYALVLYPDWKKRGVSLLLGLAPWMIVNGLSWIWLGKPEIASLVSYPSENYLLPIKFPLAPWDNIYLFPLIYFLLILYYLYYPEHNVEALQRYSMVSLLLMFATAYVGQSPHYWTWLLPFLTLEIARNRRLLPVHIAQIVCLAVYGLLGGRATAGYLFGPIAPDFFWSLPSPIEIISRFVPAETLISLAHTAFSALTLWMAYLVFRRTAE